MRWTSGFASLVLSLELQKGANFDEARVGPQHGDEGHLLLKMFIEADEEGVDA